MEITSKSKIKKIIRVGRVKEFKGEHRRKERKE